MVAVPGTRKSSCNAGELDPLLAGRPDIKQYYSGGLAFKNFEPVPQSGFRLMPGTCDAGPVRNTLKRLDGVKGGIPAYNDVFWEVEFPDDFVSAITIENAKSAASCRVQAEVFTLENIWMPFGRPVTVNSNAVNRNLAAPPGKAVKARRLRLRYSAEQQNVTIPNLYIYKESEHTPAPRYCRLKVDQDLSYLFSFGAYYADIWKGKDWVGMISLPNVSETILPDMDFYAEASTIGIFHENLKTLRIRRASSDHEWTVDEWPYDNIPEVDYGGNYQKTEDIWSIMLRCAENFDGFALDVTIDGERTRSIVFGGNWQIFKDNATGAINELPSIGGGVWIEERRINDKAHELKIHFAGKLTGREYQLSALVNNTANVSALPSHLQVGKTGGEPIISAARGWPGTCALLQDRLAYARMKSMGGAQLLSEVGEYFNVNIKATADNAARLDRLRSQTAEKILRVKESKYFLLFTNEGVYFAPNRVISRNEPLNYVNSSEIGIRPNTNPIDLEGVLYYVSNNGQQVLSMIYDDVSTSFNAKAETLLASHLVKGILRNARQTGSTATDTNRMWLLRNDGRLISANVIKDQEIMGLCEWCSADGGNVKEIIVDGKNDTWICVERNGRLRHEYMQEGQLFQQAVATKTDLGGKISDLPFEENAIVWGNANGAVLGPYVVQGGTVQLPASYASIIIGRWIAPVYESMPHLLVTDDDRILRRPGRIHTANINVLETTSIAVGANNEPAEDIPLLTASDPVNRPLPPKNQLLVVSGLMGHVLDTTLVITQVRPGSLQVRDYSTGEKL